MKKIIHISDLHFGRINTLALEALHAKIMELQPDFIVVSGDLTQRAKREEYEAAAAFLKTLPCGYLIVPGNHDIPLYRFWERLFKPFGNFRKFISTEVDPVYAKDESFVVVGVNTSRPYLPKGGRVSGRQLSAIKQSFAAASKTAIRIIVTHHPILENQSIAKTIASETRFDLWLSGHIHTKAARLINGPAGNFIECSAGTAASTRLRHAENSFNLISLDWPSLTVQAFDFSPEAKKFMPFAVHSFVKSTEGWTENTTPSL